MKVNETRKPSVCTPKIIKTNLLTFFNVSNYIVAFEKHKINTNSKSFCDLSIVTDRHSKQHPINIRFQSNISLLAGGENKVDQNSWN